MQVANSPIQGPPVHTSKCCGEELPCWRVGAANHGSSRKGEVLRVGKTRFPEPKRRCRAFWELEQSSTGLRKLRVALYRRPSARHGWVGNFHAF